MNDNEKTFKVDNEISSTNRKKDIEEKMSYNKIVDEIDKEKNHIKFIDDLRDRFINLNKRFNRCLDLLNLSMRGSDSSSIDEIMSNNMASISSVCDKLDAEKEDSKNKINDLYYKKDNFEKDKEDNLGKDKKE